jgi:hypothetical protein
MGLTRLITAFSLVAVLGLCFAPFSLAQSGFPVPNPGLIPTTIIGGNGDFAVSGNIWNSMGNSGLSVNGVNSSWSVSNPNVTWLNPAGVIFPLSVNTSSVTTGNITVPSTIYANSFLYQGDAIRVRLQGHTAANANTKTVVFNFGSTAITLLSAASNGQDVYADIEIVKTGTNTQQINVAGWANGALLNNLSTTSTQADTANIVVSVQLNTATANNDFVLTGFTIYGEP